MSSMLNRDEQVRKLTNLLDTARGANLPQCVFINGLPSTGKTYTINYVLNNISVQSVVINCIEVYTQQLLYEYVIKHIQPEYAGKCDNMLDFINFLQTEEELIIVLDRAERLRSMESNLLPSFTRLQELAKVNVCTVLISQIPIDSFYSSFSIVIPTTIYFPQYTKEQLIDIISLNTPADYPRDFYKNFLRLVLSICFMACRDLQEIRHLADLNFPIYCEPIKRGEATTDDLRKLWRNIEPHLKKSMNTIYLREISSTQWERLQKESTESDTKLAITTSVTQKTFVELPFYSKFLLIAAYLASYNPSTSDKRFFMKNAGRLHKSSKVSQVSEKKKLHLVGPKPFQLNRLLAIFFAIVDKEDKVSNSAKILLAISSMVTLNLLSQQRSFDPLDSPKYKCLVSLNFIKQIAKTVDFEIMSYLYDFV